VDCGATFKSHNLETVVPSHIEFDDRRDHIFLVHDLVSPEKRLYVTKNFGDTFSPVQVQILCFSISAEFFFRANMAWFLIALKNLRVWYIR
jgi:hypothetical protein